MLCSDRNVTCNKGYTYIQDEVCMYGLGNGHYVLEIPLDTVSFNPFQNEVLWAYIYYTTYPLAQCACFAYHSIDT